MSEVNFAELEERTMRAFLATTIFEVTGRQVRMSDQARRLGIMLCRQTFGCRPRPREGVSVRSHVYLAECLGMDASDCRKAIDRLMELQLLQEEPRGEWLYYTLTPGRLTLNERACKARDAWSRLETAQLEANEVLIVRCDEERADGGLRTAMAAHSREQAVCAGLLTNSAGPRREGAVNNGESPRKEGWRSGKVPESGGEIPRSFRGDSPEFTNGQSRARPRVRGDSLTNRQIDDSNESDARRIQEAPHRQGPETGSGMQRFRDDDRNWLVWELEELEPSLKQPGPSRWAWLGRVRDHADLLPELVGEVKDGVRLGKVKSPLGNLYSKLRAAGRALGRVVKLMC